MKGVVLLSLSLLLCVAALTGAEEGKADSLLRQAVSLAEKGDLDRAEAAAREALRESGHFLAHDRLGYILLRKGDYSGALPEFRRALEINPRLASSKTGIGFVLLSKGDLDGAEELLKDALVFNPSPALTLYALGLVCERKGDWKGAIGRYREGLGRVRER